MRSWKWVLIFALIAVVGYVIWRQYSPPPGVEAYGSETDETIAKIGLYSAIASAAASFFTMLEKLFGFLGKARKE